MSTTILVIGLIIFLSHFLSLQFRRTSIPDVLILTFVGMLIGPILGLVNPTDFGKVGSLIATIALVVILFEGGTSLKLNVLGKSLGTTGILAVSSFVLTAIIVSTIGYFLLNLSILPAALLGFTLGSTSSAVVIPLVNALHLSEKPSTVLVLESAMTDVLSIVGVFALLQIHSQGDIEAGKLIGSVLAALVFAAVIGVAGGIGWLIVLGKVRDFPNTISSTLAYAFILYGLTEFLGYSGAIASLALGVTLTNFEKFGLKLSSNGDKKLEPLNETELTFYSEAVFLLKTYFFVYLGISIQFGSPIQTYAAIAMIIATYLMRLIVTRYVVRGESYDLRDAAITSMMAPKGLAAAVLATLPLDAGVIGGEIIRDVTYVVILVSISLTAILVMLYPNRISQLVYSRILQKTATHKTVENISDQTVNKD